MTKRSIFPVCFALALSLFSLCYAANDNPHSLKTILPGVGNGAFGGVGVDLANEVKDGTILPVANGGTGAALAFPLSVTLGGTGAATLTAKGIIFGNGTSAVGITAAGTAGIPLIGAGAGNPAFGTAVVGGGGTGVVTLTSNGVLIGNGTSAITVTAEGATGIPLVGITGADPAFGTASVAGGGTGATTLADGGIMLGSGTGAVTVTAQPTNGQLLIGSTGVDPVLATLTGTANQVVVTGGAGTITLSAPQDIAAASSPTFAAVTLTAALTVPNGGTGAGTFTSNGVMIGNGTSAMTVTAEGATGIPLIGATGADPVFGTATVPGGGTGATTLTDHGLLVGSGTAAVDALAAGTNGQVPIGSTGADPVFATIGSTGATITSTLGAGTLNMDVATDLMIHKTVAVSSANILAMNAAPVELIAAPAAGKNIIVHKVLFTMVTTGTAYANGGVVVFQIGNAAAGAGTETTAQIAAAVVTAGAGTSYTTVIPVSYTGTAATGLFISNETAPFITGTGTATADIWYSVQ